MCCSRFRVGGHQLSANDPYQRVPWSMSRWMSFTRHTVILAPSLIGFGKRPSLIPAHQVDLLTGIGPLGPIMEDSRRNPVAGSLVKVDMVSTRLLLTDADCLRRTNQSAGKARNSRGRGFRLRPSTCRSWIFSP